MTRKVSPHTSGENIGLNPGEDLLVSLNTGKKFQIQDSGANPIFEVREDGSIHGKTGAGPVVFDL